MPKFLKETLFLENETAKRLYLYAKDLPIFDYHCHLSPVEIYENKPIASLAELWLKADHYKWRLMRAYGISEDIIAQPDIALDKFCEALPAFIGNPVYHWAHLELKRYFGLTWPICREYAPEIKSRVDEILARGKHTPRTFIEMSKVDTVITTDDPCDDLKYHKLLKNENLNFDVLPCFRPDNIVNIEKDGFAEYIAKLGALTKAKVEDLSGLMTAVGSRIEYFVAAGCKSADISFTDFPTGRGDRQKAERALKARLDGKAVGAEDAEEYKFVVLSEITALLAAKNIVVQFHVGVMRNCNSALFEKRGADAGGDSVANIIDINAARALFDAINIKGGLPKTIVYTLNPAAYYPLATLIGDFQGGERGKMQLGAAWWFADHRDGIKENLRIIAATGGLGLFNGMLTDSRSFSSFVRHDYFRRIFCSFVGELVERGEYPYDDKQLKELIYNVCYGNAKNYFAG